MDIKSSAEHIARYFRTRNPFVIAKSLGILVLFEPLGTIRGYYSKAKRQKFIHINSGLPEYLQKFVCAHELGHAILHPDANTPFLRSSTLLSVDRYELEANRFAAYLLLPDSELRECLELGYTVEQAAAYSGLPDSLVIFRIQSLLGYKQ